LELDRREGLLRFAAKNRMLGVMLAFACRAYEILFDASYWILDATG